MKKRKNLLPIMKDLYYECLFLTQLLLGGFARVNHSYYHPYSALLIGELLFEMILFKSNFFEITTQIENPNWNVPKYHELFRI